MTSQVKLQELQDLLQELNQRLATLDWTEQSSTEAARLRERYEVTYRQYKRLGVWINSISRI